MDKAALKNYIKQTIEYLKEDAIKAKATYKESKTNEEKRFNDGVLMGYYYSIVLFKQQAEAFGINLQDIGLSDIDPDKDLLNS